LLGFLCFVFFFPKEKNQDFLLARNSDFISFFLGFFWHFSFFGAKEKPGFMVTEIGILLHFPMSFAVGLGFSAVGYSL
jgi:hypothetical protein